MRPKKLKRNRLSCIHAVKASFLIFFMLYLWCSQVMAVAVVQDMDLDGEADFIFHSGVAMNGTILVESDNNEDGIMDQFYYVKNGMNIRIETDSDFDNKIDGRVYYSEGKVICQEKINKDGLVYEITDFDEDENWVRRRIDSNGDGNINQVIHYNDGKPVSYTDDTDNDKKVNVWQDYINNKPYMQMSDTDGDNILDYMTRFDSEGQLFSRSLDSDKNGFMDTFRLYEAGELKEEKETGTLTAGMIP